MPLRKPKAVPLPKPFADLERSPDDHARRRALLMKRELDQAGGFSWDEAQPGFWQRIRESSRPTRNGSGRQRWAWALSSSAASCRNRHRHEGPDFIVYADSWSGDRTAEDAIADREEAMDKLRAEVAANRAALAAAQARQKALEAERAAARQASS
jgi:hypothetical protein